MVGLRTVDVGIMDTHAKFDKLRNAQWSELIALPPREVGFIEEIRRGKPVRL